MRPEQMEDRRTIEAILLKEQEHTQRTSRVVSVLAESLLGGPDAVSRISAVLCEYPIRPSMSFSLREKPLFKELAKQFHPAIRTAYGELWLTRLQSVCHDLPVLAYNSAEVWFRRQTLTGLSRRPGVTLALAWFVIAIHNWIWWSVYPKGKRDGRDLSNDQDARLPSASVLQDDIGVFLTQAEESSCGAADLIAMHMIALQLLRRLAPKAAERAGPPGDEKPGAWVAMSAEAAKKVPTHLAAHWERIRLISPVSRLLMLDPASHPDEATTGKEPAVASEKWNWLPTLLDDPGAKPLRQYLSSRLGGWLSNRKTAPEDIHRILHVLEQLREVVEQKADLSDGWNGFLSQLLWATLDERHSESLTLLWDRWAEGGTGLVPLARWCGRLAYDAEWKARHTPCHRLPDWTWTWYDLARTTLTRWVVGRRRAVLCLGLWLEGYLENHQKVPPLTLGGQASQSSLNDIIDQWLGLSRPATDNLRPQYEEPEHQKEFVESVVSLAERLSRKPVIVDRAEEAAMRQPPAEKPEKTPSAPGVETPGTEFRARIYRFTR